MRKSLQSNKAPAQAKSNPALNKVRRSIYWQAGLAVMTIVLTVVIVFAMTSAWYTNVVHSSGLTFEAAAWGFDGTITVAQEPVQAAPGDEGVVALSVVNSSDNISDVSVNISKATMAAEMQKRIYFYVDTQLTRNEEAMNRVYLSNQESYTYTLFNKGTLTLSETYHNDAQLKWQWVYDVLGYYVLATQTTAADADGAVSESMTVHEYLRPIEYDYDEATTTFRTQTDAEGNETTTLELKTVDGKTTVEEFLIKLSQSDGYRGEIDPANKNSAGYYPVDVDEDGYGVWAYLCTYSEIQMNTQYDTKLGEAAAQGTQQQMTAKLTVSAQKSKTNIETVGTAAALQELINENTEQVIQLEDDIVLSAALSVIRGQRIFLDLNGHTLTNETEGGVVVNVSSGSALTMTNGVVTGDPKAGYGVVATGAEITMHNVEMNDVAYGVYINDSAQGNSLDSKVRLIGCTLTTGQSSIYVLGNGEASGQTTQLVVEGCTIDSGYIGVTGNGTATGDGKWGTDVQIIDSTVTGHWAAIYQPQKESTATIHNSVMSGITGIVIKGGTVFIEDSRITGTGPFEEPLFASSGFSDTGDAVYIETGYGNAIGLEVSGSSILETEDEKCYSIQVYGGVNDNTENVLIRLYGGTYDEEQPAGYLAQNAAQAEVTQTDGKLCYVVTLKDAEETVQE